MNISSALRLPQDSFFNQKQIKDLIILHHTVGGSAKSTFEYWRTDQQHIGTAFIVERDGTIHEVFPPDCWAFHLGLKTTSAVDKRSIGIEIASEGALLERAGNYYAFGRLTEQTRFPGPVYDCGADKPYRGYHAFAQYTPQALAAVCELVDHLLTIYSIVRQTPANHVDCDLSGYTHYQGVLTHCQLRPDKTDVHPGFAWDQLVSGCGLVLTGAPALAMSAAKKA